MLTDLEVAAAAAEAAAEVVRRGFGSSPAATFKGAVNPVTEIDRRAEEAILGIITRHRPDDEILAEESGGGAWDGTRVWIVDPLDGTVNFLHGLPHVAVSVGLWDQGRPVAGVVVDPLRREVFSAIRDGGAWLNGSPIRCSAVSDVGRSLIATGFPYDRQQHAEEYTAIVTAVLQRFQGIRRLGSAALDICWVGCGRYEGYWEYGLGAWDAAAAVLVAEEAGAKVSAPDRDDFRLDDVGVVVANTSIHADLTSIVNRHRPRHLR